MTDDRMQVSPRNPDGTRRQVRVGPHIGPLRLTPTRVTLGIALFGSAAFLLYAITVRDASQIPLLSSGAAVLGMVLGARGRRRHDDGPGEPRGTQREGIRHGNPGRPGCGDRRGMLLKCRHPGPRLEDLATWGPIGLRVSKPSQSVRSTAGVDVQSLLELAAGRDSLPGMISGRDPRERRLGRAEARLDPAARRSPGARHSWRSDSPSSTLASAIVRSPLIIRATTRARCCSRAVIVIVSIGGD